MRHLLFGIVAIVVIGIGGLVYRNTMERPLGPVACPLDARVCPDGTSVGRTGPSCTFAACPPPNVTLEGVGITYALPSTFMEAELADEASVAAYQQTPQASSSTEPSSIVIRRYPITASSTALATIQQTAIGAASGEPVPVTAYSSIVLGPHRLTVVSIERFEAVVNTAYYLARSNDVLRFDAIDRGVVNWTDPSLDVTKLPAHTALRQMIASMQGG